MDDDSEDLLLHRALTGEAQESDWTALDAIAARDALVWERLARSLRDAGALARALQRETAAAVFAIELPRGAAVPAPAMELALATRTAALTKNGATPWARWGGWLAAAALALFAVVSQLSPPATRGDAGPGVVSIGELPKILLEARPRVGATGYEVLYVRRLIERTVLPALYELHADDAGRAVAVPSDPARFATETSL